MIKITKIGNRGIDEMLCLDMHEDDRPVLHDALAARVEAEEELWLPGKRVVCGRCDGKGTHVNPAVDGDGWTREEMDEQGPEFFEDYMGGVYDVTCHECRGRNVVEEIGERDDTWADWQVQLLDQVNEWFQAEYEYQQEVAAEIRAGC